ncbi:LysR family transcriptional regulator [uncultured Microbulbifer sp.]|uniref:LysR family transcriptional regulator n=1 Tax=uncultured Microbulbifer sp. TaxID=348147 RepID=UPI00262EAAFB|nr:LysR family transcriptional regulator [uncultured Microbulbifer sp.]
MTRLSHLNSLQALEAAIRCGSLKKAARELNISAAAVGQRIRTLEEYIGRPLLTRDSSGLVASSELREAEAQLAQGFACLQQAAETLRIPHSNRVTVAGNADWQDLWLRPRIQYFTQQHPEIELFVAGNPPSDPSGLNEPDLTVEFCEGEADTLLFREYQLPLISPENKARIQHIAESEKLDGFPLLHLLEASGDPKLLNWPGWVKQFGGRSSGAERGVRYSRLTHGLQGVHSHAGVLLGGVSLLIDEMESGKIELPFAAEKGRWSHYGYHLQLRPQSSGRKPVQVFVQWLCHQAASTREQLERLVTPKTVPA